MVLQNGNKLGAPPEAFYVAPATFDNHWDEIKAYQLAALPLHSRHDSPVSFGSECFTTLKVCVSTNLIASRYAVTSFSAEQVGGGRGYYRTTREVDRGSSGSFFGALKALVSGSDVDEPETIFRDDGWFAVVPPDQAVYLGAHSWTETDKAFELKKIDTVDERTALNALVQDPDFRSRYVDWIPLVQRRLQKLSSPAGKAADTQPLATKHKPAKRKKN